MDTSRVNSWLESIVRQPAIKLILRNFDLADRERQLLVNALIALNLQFNEERCIALAEEEAQRILAEIDQKGTKGFVQEEWNQVLTIETRYRPFVEAFASMGLRKEHKKLSPDRQIFLWGCVLAIFKLLRKEYPRKELPRIIA